MELNEPVSRPRVRTDFRRLTKWRECVSRLLRLVCLTAAMLFAIPVAISQNAQSPTPASGTLHGLVRDTTGKAVSGARVVLDPRASGKASGALTDSSGHFS